MLQISMCSSQDTTGPQLEAEEQAESKVPTRAFKKYFSAGANSCRLIFVVIILLFSQVVTNSSDYFVTYWTQQELRRSQGEQVSYTTKEYLLIYTLLIIGVIMVCLNVKRGI